MSIKNSLTKRKNDIICDPATCDNCMYIGDGDFVCDVHEVMVVSDWQPTEDYLICKTEATERREKP